MTDPIVNLWTAQQADARALTFAELAERAALFRRRMRIRDGIEYIAGGLVVAVLGHIAIEAPDWGVRAASLVLIAGACLVMRNLWRRRPANDPAALAQNALGHYRGLLIAQQHALASVARWYLAPFLPGMILLIATTVRAQTDTIPLAAALLNGGIATAVTALIFGTVFWLNRNAARTIAAEIELLDATDDPVIN